MQYRSTDLPGITTKGTKCVQQLQGPNHSLSRWRGQPVKLHDVVNAHGLELQHCAGQLTALHLWHTAVGQSLEVLLCAQPEAQARPHPASTSCSQTAPLPFSGGLAGTTRQKQSWREKLDEQQVRGWTATGKQATLQLHDDIIAGLRLFMAMHVARQDRRATEAVCHCVLRMSSICVSGRVSPQLAQVIANIWRCPYACYACTVCCKHCSDQRTTAAVTAFWT